MFIGTYGSDQTSQRYSQDSNQHQRFSINSSNHENLDETILSSQRQMFVQKKGKDYQSTSKITIKATLDTDHTKSLMVEISFDESITYLQQLIAEMIYDNYSFPHFSKLDGLRAYSLKKRQGTKQYELPPDTLIGQHFFKDVNNDEVYFLVESLNFWLKLKFKLFQLPQASAVVEGSIDVLIDKDENMLKVYKKIQILMIKIWYNSGEFTDDTFYMIEKFQIDTLMPPVDKKVKENAESLRNSNQINKSGNEFQQNSQDEDAKQQDKFSLDSSIYVNQNYSISVSEKQEQNQKAQCWFDYINSLECSVYFNPFLTCRLPRLIQSRNSFNLDNKGEIPSYILEDDLEGVGNCMSEHNSQMVLSFRTQNSQMNASQVNFDYSLQKQKESFSRSRTQHDNRFEATQYENEVLSKCTYLNAIVRNDLIESQFTEFIRLACEFQRDYIEQRHSDQKSTKPGILSTFFQKINLQSSEASEQKQNQQSEFDKLLARQQSSDLNKTNPHLTAEFAPDLLDPMHQPDIFKRTSQQLYVMPSIVKAIETVRFVNFPKVLKCMSSAKPGKLPVELRVKENIIQVQDIEPSGSSKTRNFQISNGKGSRFYTRSDFKAVGRVESCISEGDYVIINNIEFPKASQQTCCQSLQEFLRRLSRVQIICLTVAVILVIGIAVLVIIFVVK